MEDQVLDILNNIDVSTSVQTNTSFDIQQQLNTQQPTIPPGFQPAGPPPQAPETLEDKLTAHRVKWTEEIATLNEYMRTLPKVNDLMNIIYAKRQEAVDYNAAMNMVILKQTKLFKQQANDMINTIKTNGYKNMRVQTDTAINKIIEAELGEMKLQIDLLTSHNNYIRDTIATIDNMIYGINQKVRLGEILNGIKF